MHSFDNSNNKERRANNWLLLEKFFIKTEISFYRKDFDKILNDNDIQQLIDFMIKLYQFLTHKKYKL